MVESAPYHHGDLPTTLLRAVGQIIAEEGVGGVSVRAVARRAGVSHAAPAHHFGDRGGLLAAYAADSFVRLRRVMEEAVAAVPATGTAADALRAMGRAYIAFGGRHPGAYNVMFRPELVDCAAPPLVHAGGCAYAALLATTRACLDAEAGDEDVLVVAMTAWSGIHGFLSLQLDMPSAEVDHLPEVNPLQDPVMDLMLAGMAAHPRWVGDRVPVGAIPADLTDPLVPVDPADLPQPAVGAA